MRIPPWLGKVRIPLWLCRPRSTYRQARAWWVGQPHHVVAAILLLTCWVTFYAWGLAPEHLQAEAWNMGGAFGRSMLLLLVVLAYRSAPVTAVALWWVFEDAQVIGCGAGWVVAGPWSVPPGEGRCTGLTGWPMGLIGSSLGAVAAWVVHKHARSAR
jgi:hypothetical protein